MAIVDGPLMIEAGGAGRHDGHTFAPLFGLRYFKAYNNRVWVLFREIVGMKVFPTVKACNETYSTGCRFHGAERFPGGKKFFGTVEMLPIYEILVKTTLTFWRTTSSLEKGLGMRQSAPPMTAETDH